MQVTTHVTTAVMARLPVPRPPADSREFNDLATISRRLAASGVADDSGDYAELNAVAAHLYGITRDDYVHILDSFPLLPVSLRATCLATYPKHSLKH
jgi:hypothetical protein